MDNIALLRKMISAGRDERGSIATITVIMMVVFIGLLAVVIDLGHLHTVQSELRTAADACALRGARAFFADDLPVGGIVESDDPRSLPDPDRAKTQASLTIGDNRSDNNSSANVSLTDLPIGEIDVGIWYYKSSENPDPTQPLQSWGWPPPASEWGKFIGPGIRLPVKRDPSHNSGSVGMTLANLLGSSSVPVRVKAAAALSGVGQYPEGYGTFPIAVDVSKVSAVGDILFFSPDLSDVGGWTSLGPDNASASVFKGLVDKTISSSSVQMGDTISLQNGVACTAIKEAIKVYPSTPDPLAKGVYYPNPQPLIWFPGVKVDKFNQTAKVEGGLFAYITEMRDSNAPKDILIPGSNPPKYTGSCMLKLKIVSGVAGGTPGGGPYYGVLSTEPKLVQ